MEIHTLTHVKEALEKFTSKAHIRVNRNVWPVITIKVPFNRVKQAQALQKFCSHDIKLIVSRLSIRDHFLLDKVVIDKSM